MGQLRSESTAPHRGCLRLNLSARFGLPAKVQEHKTRRQSKQLRATTTRRTMRERRGRRVATQCPEKHAPRQAEMLSADIPRGEKPQFRLVHDARTAFQLFRKIARCDF
jgi:hypothetical protein